MTDDKKASVIPGALQEASGVVKPSPQKPKRKTADLEGLFVRLDPAVIRQLRILCAETGKSQTEAVSESLNMLFARYGKSQIA